MRSPRRRAAIVVAVALAAAVAGGSASPALSGSTVREEVLQPGGARYTIAVPARYEPGQPVPLVLALHYGGRVTPYYGKPFLTGLVEPALRKLGAIIVAPDCTAGRWTEPRAEADVLALLDHVRKTWSIDERRTLITGYSMGGSGAWALAARHQDRFAAAVIVSGQPSPDSAEVPWRIPLYVIHSRNDDVIPLEPTAELVKQLRAKGVEVQLVVLERPGHYEIPAFYPSLRRAVPWIESVWRR